MKIIVNILTQRPVQENYFRVKEMDSDRSGKSEKQKIKSRGRSLQLIFVSIIFLFPVYLSQFEKKVISVKNKIVYWSRLVLSLALGLGQYSRLQEQFFS